MEKLRSKLLQLLLLSGLFFLVILPLNAVRAQEQQPVTIHFFHSETCPHCKQEQLFLNEFIKGNPLVTVKKYEITTNPDNIRLFKRVSEELDIDTSGVPVTIIGTTTIIGFGNAKTTGSTIKMFVDAYQGDYSDRYVDAVTSIFENQSLPDTLSPPLNILELKVQSEHAPQSLSVPLVGTIQAQDFSLPVFTFIIGLLDGFNPCAMWVLVFLISLLLGMKDKRRMWVLGSVFIAASAFVYFLFMAAWLNLLVFLGVVIWVRIAIGLFAIGAGTYYLYDYQTNKEQACKVTHGASRQKILDKLKAFAQDKHLFVAVLGIILLAFAVNLVEAICSAGLPAVYTQVLAMSDLPTWQYYAYIFFYIFIFMIDDLIVFVLAMKTLEVTGMSTRYSRISRLVGGIILLIIGLLMLFKPELITFGG